MAVSVGDIVLNLLVNRNGFDRQMQGIQGIAKKAGIALAAAFSVSKLVEFGSKCLELGSDLAEVQNVVDVTFPAMSKQVDKFAKKAAAAFGLSETMAKQYTGTFGAMAKAFGFTEKQAYDMGTTLTGLAGDVASFYNLSQDEAYTKLKSVFTGETESLKDLGIVMTQTALDAYALANGWGKTTAAMSETEKVALRYAFVQKQLTLAQGDFARTSDGWANQVRILKLQMDSIMATVGQGLINLLTPVIKLINTAISKLATLANAFKSLTELLTGNKSSPGEGITEAAEAAAGLESAAEGAGNAAEKAAKKLKGLMSFDKLNNQTDSKSGSGSDTAGSSVDFGSLAEGADEAQAAGQKINPVLDSIMNRLNELGDLFKKGFKAGLGGDFEASLKRTRQHLDKIRESLIDIFTDPMITASANQCADRIAYALGQAVGASVSVGQTIIENLVGGIDLYLKQNSKYIKKRLVGIFDATGEIAVLGGNFAEAFAYVFEIFRGDTAKQCTADIIGIFSNAFMGVLQLGLAFQRDIFNCMVQPFIDNKDKIRQALENTLKPLDTVLAVLNASVKDTFEKIFEVYDTKIRPAYEGIAAGISSFMGTVLDCYNQYIAPVLDGLAEKFSEVWQGHVQPMIHKAVELFGKLAQCISVLWQNVFVPFAEWLTTMLVPVLAPIAKVIGETFLNAFGALADAVSGVLDILGGLIDFITGVFSYDWEKCWSGIEAVIDGFKKVFGAILDAVVSRAKGCFNILIESVNGFLSLLGGSIKNTVDTAKNRGQEMLAFVSNLFNKMKDSITTKINAARNAVKSAVDAIKGFFHFEWKLPPIKLPHFEMTGKFSLDPPSVPKLGVKWYAKGGIISSPTLAMMGENNKREAVVPLERNLEWRDAIANKILEKTGVQGSTGGGLTASEARSIMMEAVTAFAEIIAGIELKATIDQRDAYRAVEKEFQIRNKPKGKRL